VDGVFGYKTAEAVRNFQSFFRLKQKGTVSDEEFEILKELMQAGINRWHAPRHNFAYTGYVPSPISTQLVIKKTWNIPGIIGLNSTSDRIIVTAKNHVTAVSLISGNILWKNSRLSPQAASVISEGQLIVPAQSLEILDLYSGKKVASFMEDIFTTSVAAKGNKIYASAGGTIYAFDRMGNVLWSYRTLGASCTSPTLGYDFIYFASYDRNIYCFDENGMSYWKTKISDIVKLPLAIWDGKIFAVTQDSWIIAINPLAGNVIWQKKFTDEEFLMPAFHPDFMLLVNCKGEAVALSFQSAQLKWATDLPAVPTTSPAVLKDTFFIGTEDGLVVCNIGNLECARYLEGEKIVAIVPTALSLFAATERQLVKLGPAQNGPG